MHPHRAPSFIMNSSRCMSAAFLVVLCGAQLALATEVEGKLALPDLAAKDAQLVLALETGSSLRTYSLPGGKFAFHNVPTGKHYLDVDVLGLVFPTVELTVFADGEIHALHSDLPGRPLTPYPLLVKPVGKMEYFEKQAAFNVMAFLKTPYGLMIAFMVFSIFIMPHLRSLLEEPQQQDAETAVAEQRQSSGGGAPSPRRKNQ